LKDRGQSIRASTPWKVSGKSLKYPAMCITSGQSLSRSEWAAQVWI